MKTLIAILIPFVAFCPVACAERSETIEFRKFIEATYDFDPADLSSEEQSKKVPALDGFAKHVLSDKAKYLPLLKAELKNPEHGWFFLFDGASLLFREAKDKDDLQICADAIVHARLEGLQGSSYFYFVVDLGKNGIDTYPLVEKILDFPEMKVFIPQHSLMLEQTYVVTYALLQLDEDLYIDQLIGRLKRETNQTTAATIINVLAGSVTKKANAAIASFGESTQDEELREFIDSLKHESQAGLPPREVESNLEDVETLLLAFRDRKYVETESLSRKIHRDLPYLVRQSDYSMIKRIRRDMAYRISDESIEEIAFLNYLLRLSFSSTAMVADLD